MMVEDQSDVAEQNQPVSETPNLIKTRDDHRPIAFVASQTDEGVDEFAVVGGDRPSWAKSGHFGTENLRERVEPWLTALCQSEHLSLLVGSGVSAAVHGLAVQQPFPGMGLATFGSDSALIDREARRSASVAGRGQANLEDQLRAAHELVRGLEILGLTDEAARERAQSLSSNIKQVVVDFVGRVLSGERNILRAAAARREEAIGYLVSFLMSFASRTGTRDRLHIFTTNYDRLIEAGAEVAGIHLLDRFTGSIAPVFRASRLDLDLHYNPPGIRGEPRYLEGVARFTKLHGSLDWFEHRGSVRRLAVPLGAENVQPFLDASGEADQLSNLLVYPNAAKDRETAGFPYVDLFRDFAASVCRPNHTLMVFGHSLGDEHINRVVKDMLTIPSTHLVIMAYDDPLGRIQQLYRDTSRPAQTTLLVGSHIGDFRTLVDRYLPKPAIDKTTFRMAELLRQRWTRQSAADGPLSPEEGDRQ